MTDKEEFWETFDEYGFCSGCGREVDCTEWNGDCSICEPQEIGKGK